MLISTFDCARWRAPTNAGCSAAWAAFPTTPISSTRRPRSCSGAGTPPTSVQAWRRCTRGWAGGSGCRWAAFRPPSYARAASWSGPWPTAPRRTTAGRARAAGRSPSSAHRRPERTAVCSRRLAGTYVVLQTYNEIPQRREDAVIRGKSLSLSLPLSLLLLLLVLLAACANVPLPRPQSDQDAKRFDQPAPDKGALYIYRPGRLGLPKPIHVPIVAGAPPQPNSHTSLSPESPPA